MHALGQTEVLDEDLNPVEPGSGVVGKIARSGDIPLGYYNDPNKTAEVFPTIRGTRYVMPGDFATVEADGSITLLGRGSIVINSGGEKIFPEEVESAVRSHPDVMDAIVCGAPDERWGQTVAAIIQPRVGHEPPSLESLQAHCRTTHRRLQGSPPPACGRRGRALTRAASPTTPGPRPSCTATRGSPLRRLLNGPSLGSPGDPGSPPEMPDGTVHAPGVAHAMMQGMPPGQLLLLTGSPGCGKSTIAPLVADHAPLSVCLDLDWFFAKLRSGALEPWREEAHQQNRVVLSAAASAVATFTAGRLLHGGRRHPLPVHARSLRQRLRTAGDRAQLRRPQRATLRSCSPASSRDESNPEHAGALADERVVEDLWRMFEDHDLEPRHRVDVAERSPDEIADEIYRRCGGGELLLLKSGGRWSRRSRWTSGEPEIRWTSGLVRRSRPAPIAASSCCAPDPCRSS